MEKTKREAPISAACLIVGCILLVNPSVRLFDYLPDSIGYLLLFFGIRRLRDAVPPFEDALRALEIMVGICLTKIPALFTVSMLGSANTNDKTLSLLVIFGYAVLECIFLYRVFRNLFDGFFYLADRFGVTAAGVFRTKSGKIYDSSRLFVWTYGFFIVRAFLSVLPESLYLASEESLATGTVNYLLARYYAPVFVISFAVCIVCGILWLFRVLPYFRAVAADEALPAAMEEALSARPSAYRIALSRFRRERLALVFFSIGAFFFCDMTVDGVNLFPDFIASIAFILCAVLVRHTANGKPSLFVYIAAGSHAAVSVFDFTVWTMFSTRYSVADLHRVRMADKLYSLGKISGISKNALACLLVCAVLYLLYALLRDALLYGRESGATLFRSDTVLLSEYKRKLILPAVFCGLDAILSAFHPWINAIVETIAADEAALGTPTVTVAKYGWFWILILAVSLLAFAFSYHTAGDLRDEIRVAYGIEE